MRILLISQAPVNAGFGSGNTFLNLMDLLDNVEVASVCTRTGESDPRIHCAFYITEKMLLDNLLRRASVGRCVRPAEGVGTCPGSDRERKIQRFAHRHRWTLLFWARELLWKVSRWDSPELNAFLQECRPDIILTSLANHSHINRMTLRIKEITGAKLVLYAWDNNYTYKQLILSPLRWIKQAMDRASMRRVAKEADWTYAVCEDLKQAYESAFGREFHLLTKGGDFSREAPVKSSCNRPLQLVYTGNLQNNRWRSLEKIACVLERINRNGVRARLCIYTGSPLTKAMSRALNRGESSAVLGSLPPSDVARVQSEADMLVHVEATDLKNRLTVRHSFSTKLVDYMAAARPILAYGRADSASIRHLRDHAAAVVAESPEELYDQLTAVWDDEAALIELSRCAYDCGRMHHENMLVRNTLAGDLEALLHDPDSV